MKLTKINRDDMAAIAVAISEYDQMGGLDYVIEQIGEKLDIGVVPGEGYDTTIWRVCKLILEQEDAPTAADRAVEMLYNVGVNNANLIGAVRDERFETALAMLAGQGANSDYEVGRDSVLTILKQHQQYDKRIRIGSATNRDN